jgi:hypothetical protein
VFATLLGPLPRPPLPDDAPPEALLEACLELQVQHGIEPLTDGGWSMVPTEAGVVARWRSTAERVSGLVKAIVTGPLSTGRPVAVLREDLLDLAAAGCRWIEIHEPSAVAIGDDGAARERFVADHRALTADLGSDVHLSLAITGGAADPAAIEAILAGAYASLAVDLIDGPDNWRSAVAVPGSLGVICGALSAHAGSDDGPEMLLWAARYAAGSRGRGMDRVGLATSGSLAALPWEVAATKVRHLGEGARLVIAPPAERRASLDPRAVDSRSAALGRVEPLPPRESDGGADRPTDPT